MKRVLEYLWRAKAHSHTIAPQFFYFQLFLIFLKNGAHGEEGKRLVNDFSNWNIIMITNKTRFSQFILSQSSDQKFKNFLGGSAP